jgi:hypothetical protein
MPPRTKKRVIFLGDLVAAAYSEARRATANRRQAHEIAVDMLTRWLVQAGREDVARQLADWRQSGG